MKKCVKCGHENLDEARFCAECGHELNSSSSNSKSNRNINFKRMKSNFKKHPYLHICCIFPLIFFAMFSIAHDAQGFYKQMHAEDYQTNYPEEFNALDINEDGKLEFNEVNNIVLHTPQEKLYDIFKKSDKTGNGYLIGYEYDIYRSKATGNYYEAQYRKELEEKERIAKLYLTGADVERGIYKAKGMDFDDILAYVTQLQPEGLDIKALKIELKANNFYRGNPYVSAIGALLGFTDEQLDLFFETNDYTVLLPKEEVFNLDDNTAD